MCNYTISYYFRVSEIDIKHYEELIKQTFLCFQIAEVIRTRLREEGSKYRSFFQTLITVPREEGYRALYRGLTTHLVRQIPNTAIMMCTYEVVVYLLGR